MRGARWSRLLGTLVVIALLALATVLSSLSGTPSGRPDSSRSNAEDGRRAARLVLEELGFETHVWRRRPAELPRESTLFVLADVPSLPGDPSDSSDPLFAARSKGPHDPQYYRRFVDEGGVLALPATEDSLTWLAQSLEIEACGEMTLEGREDVDDELKFRVTEVWIPGQPERFACDVPWRAIDSLDAAVERLLVTDEDTVLALSAPVGRGAVVLWPPGVFLRNDALAEEDHGLLWVRLVEQVAPDRSVWFDEYALGDQERDSAVSLSFSPALSILTWHVLAFALIALWRGAWPRPFPRTTQLDAAVEPLARVRGQAAWFVRGRRRELLARELRRSTWADLVRRHGSRATSFDPARMPAEADVRALAQRAGADPDEWAALLVDRPPRSSIDLERLEHGLGALRGTDAAGS